jgi:glycosyltransferase involved in cell wall biosynthesis
MSTGERSVGPEVLHVVESLGGGVATALEDYIRSSAGCIHTVLAWRRHGAQTGDSLDRLVTRVIPLPHGRLAQILAVRRWVKKLNPDIIHAHSSYAGMYIRLLVCTKAARLVYTPHAYAFERKDVPALVRGLFWLAEAALSLRGGCVAAVSPREAQLAARLPGRQHIVHVPNIVRWPGLIATRPFLGDSTDRTIRVAAMGRVSPQKGPEFLCRAARISKALELPIDWVWIGGGEPAAERMLRDVGVRVTGWLPRAEALQWLAPVDVYAHTAAWEGSPLTILEAAALGLPIVARSSPAVKALGLKVLCDTPEALVKELRRLLDERRRAELAAASRRLAERHDPDSQCRALELVYSLRAEDARIAQGVSAPS